jgi:hypothetical protein
LQTAAEAVMSGSSSLATGRSPPTAPKAGECPAFVYRPDGIEVKAGKTAFVYSYQKYLEVK